MRLSSVNRIETDIAVDDRLFVMFHGYGNDEREMVRVIDAVYAGTGREASYLSFHGTYDRRYMGGAYWYPDGCGVDERRRECSAVGDAVAGLLDSPMFAPRRRILVGFSQGGYMSYRIVREHPDIFDAAILMSPSFKGEEETDGASIEGDTRFLLLYGSRDRTIPLDDQRTAHRALGETGRLESREYAGMDHAIADAEIADIRAFVGLDAH
ncbi:prolyl oligopeptidase family serine peptidase [Bifidobacterium sp. MA2]|uniref:Prolyl oligopeptidase family serine peptidase n=1 Tax=Bifidobacterium santillanense TaxID=2809028 RepID=A0ABS5UR47_9BIFI|nr:dienelactone hydrolase family protein [Bifidobacterium santillanense]MBT1173384.1 prolyl oligopeptidase family serine peptidase [Bifidobacterium santillanense]